MHLYPRPIGWISQCLAKGSVTDLATITYLGERHEIGDPEAVVLDADRV